MSDIRSRVEKTFHSIGGLLDQLAAVAAAFQGFLRQDLDGGLELPHYSREFQAALDLFRQDFNRLRAAEAKVAETAEAIRGHGPGIVDHSIHLRSCTFTLKVISARFPEISGFAQEIADCVNRIRASGQKLTELVNRVAAPDARTPSTGLDEGAQPVLEEIFRTEPAEMRIAAQEIDQMIARLMSTLQSGDIATQRLEHVVQSVELIEEGGLSGEERARFLALIDDQLAQTIEELVSNCGMFTESIQLIAGRIEVLEGNADRHRSGLAENYRLLLRRLDGYFDALQSVVRAGIDKAGSSAASQEEGPKGIEAEISAIGSAVRDIYYMALNTTLSCGRLGEGAASAAPVTTEIRYHVVHLGEIADQMAALAPVIRESLACYGDIGNQRLFQLLEAEHVRLSRQVEAMAERARQAWLSPARLHELAAELLGEIPKLQVVTDGASSVHDYLAGYRRPASLHGNETARVEALSQKIFDLYTMNLEREVHKRHFAVDVDSSDCEAINLFGATSEDGQLDLAAVLF